MCSILIKFFLKFKFPKNSGYNLNISGGISSSLSLILFSEFLWLDSISQLPNLLVVFELLSQSNKVLGTSWINSFEFTLSFGESGENGLSLSWDLSRGSGVFFLSAWIIIALKPWEASRSLNAEDSSELVNWCTWIELWEESGSCFLVESHLLGSKGKVSSNVSK